MGKEKAERKKKKKNNKIVGQTCISNLADKLDQVQNLHLPFPLTDWVTEAVKPSSLNNNHISSLLQQMNFTVQRSVKVNKRSIRHPSILFHLSMHPSGNPLEIYPIPSTTEWEEEAIAISLFQYPLCRIYFFLLFPFHPIRRDINGSSRIGSPDQILWFFFSDTPYSPG